MQYKIRNKLNFLSIFPSISSTLFSLSFPHMFYFFSSIALLSVLFALLRDHVFFICSFPLSFLAASLSLDFCLSFIENYITATEAAFFARNWSFRIRNVRELRPKRASSAFAKSAKTTVKCSCGNDRQRFSWS